MNIVGRWVDAYLKKGDLISLEDNVFFVLDKGIVYKGTGKPDPISINHLEAMGPYSSDYFHYMKWKPFNPDDFKS